MTRGELNELGWLLRRGGPRWHKYVLLARELRDGKPTRWSHELAGEIARALGLTKRPIPFGTHCHGCPPPRTDNSYPSTRTILSLPDRYVAECTRCGARWVKLTERHHLEPFSTRGECQSPGVGCPSSAEGDESAASGGSQGALVQVGVGSSNRTALAGAPADQHLLLSA